MSCRSPSSILLVYCCWSPLASGFLADGFDLDSLDPEDFRRGAPLCSGAIFTRLKGYGVCSKHIAQDHYKTMAELVIAWVLTTTGGNWSHQWHPKSPGSAGNAWWPQLETHRPGITNHRGSSHVLEPALE